MNKYRIRVEFVDSSGAMTTPPSGEPLYRTGYVNVDASDDKDAITKIYNYFTYSLVYCTILSIGTITKID